MRAKELAVRLLHSFTFEGTREYPKLAHCLMNLRLHTSRVSGTSLEFSTQRTTKLVLEHVEQTAFDTARCSDLNRARIAAHDRTTSSRLSEWPRQDLVVRTRTTAREGTRITVVESRLPTSKNLQVGGQRLFTLE